MSGKIVRLTGTFTVAKRLSDKKLAENDIAGAINVWLNIENKVPTYLVYSAIANLYSKICFYDKAMEYWFKYLMVCEKKRYSYAYYQIAVCCVKAENLELAGYYFNKHITYSEEKKSIGLNDDVFSIFEDLLGKNNGFKIVSPPEKVDYRETIYSARVDIRNGDYDSAINKLSVIPFGSDFYEESCARRIEAYYMQKKYSLAEACALKGLEKNPDSVLMHVALCRIYSHRNNRERLNKYYNKCLALPEESLDDTERKALCAVFLRDDKNVIKYIEKYLKEDPDAFNLLYDLGIAYLNLGKYKKARNCFNKLYMVERYYMYSYYTGVADKLSLKYGENVPPKSKYSYDLKLPQRDFNAITKKVFDRFVSVTKGEQINVKDTLQFISDNEDFIKGAFEDGPSQLIIMLIELISTVIKEERIKPFILDLFISPNVQAGVKQVLADKYIDIGFEGRIGFVIEGIFRILDVTKPPIDGDDQEVVNIYLRAYYRALKELILTPEDDFNKLTETITALFYNKNNDYKERDYFIIAGATLILSDYRIASKMSFIAKRLKVKSADIKKYIKSMEKRDENN